MMIAEKSFLYQTVDDLSPFDVVQNMLGDNQIEELTEEESFEHLKMLKEMNQGRYVLLDDL